MPDDAPSVFAPGVKVWLSDALSAGGTPKLELSGIDTKLGDLLPEAAMIKVVLECRPTEGLATGLDTSTLAYGPMELATAMKGEEDDSVVDLQGEQGTGKYQERYGYG